MKEIEKLKEEIRDLKKENISLDNEIRDLGYEIDDLENDVSYYKRQSRNLESEYKFLTDLDIVSKMKYDMFMQIINEVSIEFMRDLVNNLK